MGTCGRLVRLTHPHSHAVCVGRGVKRGQGKRGREMGRAGAGSRAIYLPWSSPSAGMSSTVRARCGLCEVWLPSCFFFCVFVAHSRSSMAFIRLSASCPRIILAGWLAGWRALCLSVRLSVFSCHSLLRNTRMLGLHRVSQQHRSRASRPAIARGGGRGGGGVSCVRGCVVLGHARPAGWLPCTRRRRE